MTKHTFYEILSPEQQRGIEKHNEERIRIVQKVLADWERKCKEKQAKMAKK